MDMYQKRKMRKENNNEEKSTKIGINCDVGINGNHLESIEK